MNKAVKKGLGVLMLGAAAVAMSATQSLATPIIEEVSDSAYLYTIDGTNGVPNSHIGMEFDLASHGDWGNFLTELSAPNRILGSLFLHVNIVPLDGFNTDRLRVYYGTSHVTDKLDPRLTPIAGSGIGNPLPSNGANDRVVKYLDMGVQLGSGYTEGVPAVLDVELLNWYSMNDLTNLIINNGGLLQIALGDDTEVYDATLTATVLATPEPASLVLFGSGLVGVAAWRMRKKESRG